MQRAFSKSIKGKTILTAFIISLLLGLIFALLNFITFSNQLRQKSVRYAEVNLSVYASAANDHLDSVFNLITWCRSHSDVVKFLRTPYHSPLYKTSVTNAHTRLDEAYYFNTSYKYIDRILIAGQENSLAYMQIKGDSGLFTVQDPVGLIKSEILMNDLDFRTSEYGIHSIISSPLTPQNKEVIPIIKSIEDPYLNKTIGFVYAELSPKLFTDMLSYVSSDETSNFYLQIGESVFKIKNNQLLLVKPQVTVQDITSKFQASSELTVGEYSSNGTKNLVLSYPLSIRNCRISEVIPGISFAQMLQQYMIQLILIVTLACILFGILQYVLTLRITHPILVLSNHIYSMSKGDFEHNSAVEWDDEFGEIGRSLNQLGLDFKQLISTQVKITKEKSDFEYQLLQSQVNPHFLYNTLNSIQWMAMAQGAHGIADMTIALSRLLKEISKGTEISIPLKKEIDLLNDYFTIQSYRYGGTISLNIDIEDPQIWNYRILRFTLQPFVENAIFHGIEPTGKAGDIVLYAYNTSDTTWQIDITDNGIGISQEKIDGIFCDDPDYHTSFFRDVGIWNVHKRLQCSYGELYGIKMSGIPGAFTTVSVVLPRLA